MDTGRQTRQEDDRKGGNVNSRKVKITVGKKLRQGYREIWQEEDREARRANWGNGGVEAAGLEAGRAKVEDGRITGKVMQEDEGRHGR